MEVRIKEVKAYKQGHMVSLYPDSRMPFTRSFRLSDALWLLSLDLGERNELLAQLEDYKLQIMKGTFKGV